MSEVYFSNSNLLIRSMEVDDAKIIYDTYLSYGWHPSLETYDNYYKEQEENKRKKNNAARTKSFLFTEHPPSVAKRKANF